VLEAATGLARSSLANTFGTKQDMLATSLAHYNALIAEHLIARLDDDAVEGQAALHGFFDSLAALKAEAPGSHGCLVINTLVELPERAAEIDDQISRYEDLLLTGFTTALRRTAASQDALENLTHTLLALAMTVNLHSRNHDSAKVAATTAAAHAFIDSWA
jgi:AcrR family transcriptional regulator